MTKQFSDSALLGLGWKQATERLGFFVLIFLISLASVSVPIVIYALTMNDYPVISWIAYVIYLIIIFILGIGVVKISLDIVDGKEPKIKDLFVNWRRLPTFLGTTILYTIICFVGFMLFLIPGMIWMTKFYLAPYYAIDKGLNPIESLKASSQATMGVKWDVLAFYILTQIVIMLGFLAIGIGLLVTIPLVSVATAGLYRTLSGGKLK